MSTNINLEDIHPDLADAAEIVFWLKCDETENGLTLTDAVSGAVLATEGVTVNGDGSLTIEDGISTALNSGVIPSLGNGDFAIMLVCNNGALPTEIEIGANASNHKVAISPAASSVITGVAGSLTFNSAGDFPAGGKIQKYLITAVEGGNTTPYLGDSGNVLTAGTPQLYNVHGNVTTFDAVSTFTDSFSAGNTMYSLMFLAFPNGIPADIVVASDWMMEQAINNVKEFYPRLNEL